MLEKIGNDLSNEETDLINNTKCRVNLTIDLWTSRKNKSYIAGTAHVLQINKLQNQLLFIKHFPQPHTAENIKLKFDYILSEKSKWF